MVAHLRGLLGTGDAATLCAVDGAVARDVERQLGRVPATATHLVLSAGGNDALRNYDLLNTRLRSTAEAFALFRQRLDAFARDYAEALSGVVRAARRRPVAICTIYNGDLGPVEGPIATTALSMFNDVIIGAGVAGGHDIFELRAICNEPADYANPIEPSGRGGLKIATAIAAWARGAAPAARLFR